MTPHAYSEKALVEQSAEEILVDLGWTPVSAAKETFGPSGNLGRDSLRDVVLTGRLRVALAALNPTVPPAVLELAIDDLIRDRVAMGPAAANREVYRLLTDGVTVTTKDVGTGEEQPTTVRVVDWEPPERNDFLLVSQFSSRARFTPAAPTWSASSTACRWSCIELKKPGVPRAAGVRREPDQLQAPQNGFRGSSGTTRCSSPRTARTAALARSRPIGSGSSSGSASSARTSRAACRWRSCFAAPATEAPARPGGEFHALLGAQELAW